MQRHMPILFAIVIAFAFVHSLSKSRLHNLDKVLTSAFTPLSAPPTQ